MTPTAPGPAASSSTTRPLPVLIQGGMGVAVSSWRLARTVASLGHLGVVSGVAIGNVLAQRLFLGDEDSLRALRTFPHAETVREIVERFYVPAGKNVGMRRPLNEMWTLSPTLLRERLTVAGAYVEVWLAREGHDHPVGLNHLEKIALPTLATLYGALLAGVDTVIMGAGIPLRIPGVLDALARHEATSYPVYVEGAAKGDDFRARFDPARVFPEWTERPALTRPRFYPIVSSNVLAQALLKRADGRIDGFIIEAPTAGGHNAPPRGHVELNADGEPVYGPKDVVDLEKMKELGLPFWLAGSRGRPEGLRDAQAQGAVGIQVGTAFAFCRESGMDPALRRRVVAEAAAGRVRVRTDGRASPTGFPFKVVQMAGTISDAAVREARERVCNIGELREAYKREDGSIGYRCASEPVDAYVKKGGKAEDAVGRACLCNGLTATIGIALEMKNGQPEPPVITSGDDLVDIGRFLKPGQDEYGAAEVVAFLLKDADAVGAGARDAAE